MKVIYFGMLREIAGSQQEPIEVAEGATAGMLFAQVLAKYPEMARFEKSLAIAVNLEYSAHSQPLKEGDEVALIPPVSGGNSSRCEIVRERIATEEIAQALRVGEDGAVIVFEGVVRNNTRGRRTLYLDYEAYEAMALKEMEALCEQALRDYKIRDIRIVHRIGRIEIGETSVVIVVASAHRGAAFDACRFTIDTLKKKVPIWKKEYFEDGAVWADGEPFPPEVPRD
ncbi:molybdopterin converting factor subunit 1 [Candidatus Korobacter versatilis]|uniref:molybdopterin converting factor subunit 1 n=1 Tax=Candidatus Korobacter versatilis TaxID=658062 RepID=UPI00031B0485|nr:molybdopterin converting factor subunit 1 [Candidatus Koribacter versatilis]